MNNVSELRRVLCATAWAVQHDYLRSMLASAELLSAGGAVADHTVASLKAAAAVEAARRQNISGVTGGTVAVLPLYGLIMQRSNWMTYYFGGTSVEAFTQQFRAALADPNVTAIVIDVDSPGGSVAGVDELAAEIYAARGKKTIVAISNTLNASAAYYISSAASEVWAMPSSLTGSVGVYQVHEDDSQLFANIGVKMTMIAAGKYKVEGNPYEALSPEAEAAMQQMVDGYYNLFVKAVAKGRGKKMADVIAGFGEGRMLMASDAVAAGMVDKVGTLDGLLAKFGVKRPVDGSGYAATEAEVPAAAAEPAPGPEAAKKADTGDTDDDGDDSAPDDDPCECPCDPCMQSDCSGCTADDCDSAGCKCKSAMGKRESKAAAAKAALVAAERERNAIALAM